MASGGRHGTLVRRFRSTRSETPHPPRNRMPVRRAVAPAGFARHGLLCLDRVVRRRLGRLCRGAKWLRPCPRRCFSPSWASSCWSAAGLARSCRGSASRRSWASSLAALLLGPSVLGLIWPDVQHMLFPQTAEQKSMINAVSQLGILMLLLLTGMETDLRLVRRVGRAAVTVAAAGVAFPFICGFALGEMLPDSILPNPQARFVYRAVSRHRALDLLDQDRRHGGARDELHAPRRRPDHRRFRDPRGFERMDHHRHFVRPGIVRHGRSAFGELCHPRHAVVPGGQPHHRPAHRVRD